MTTHTPGPWKGVYGGLMASRSEHLFHGSIWSMEPQKRIAVVDNAENADANMALLAAAPDLLEALRDAVSTMPVDSPVKWVLWARAAIARAEGK